MFIRRGLLTAALTAILLVQGASCRTNGANEAAQLNHKLLNMVKVVLSGTDVRAAKESVTPDSYLIDGVKYRSLHGAINGEFKDCRMTEGKNIDYSFENLKTSDDGTSAYMILKTSSPESGKLFHSIVFFKKPNGTWKIVGWHISK